MSSEKVPDLLASLMDKVVVVVCGPAIAAQAPSKLAGGAPTVVRITPPPAEGILKGVNENGVLIQGVTNMKHCFIYHTQIIEVVEK